MGLRYYVEGNRHVLTVLPLSGNFIYSCMCLTLMVQAVESLTTHHDAEHFGNKASFRGYPACLSFPIDIWLIMKLEAAYFSPKGAKMLLEIAFPYSLPNTMDIFWDHGRKVACSTRPLVFSPARSKREHAWWERFKPIMHSPGSCQRRVSQVNTPYSASGRSQALRLSQLPSL